MIRRELEDKLNESVRQFPVVSVVGPRQSGKTINPDYFRNLQYWQSLAGSGTGHSYVIYGGTDAQKRSRAFVYGWSGVSELFQNIDSSGKNKKA